MGKKLIIKNANFSANAISTEGWDELSLTEGDWSGNLNTGALVNKSGGWWTSTAVDVSSYTYVKATPSFKTDVAIIIFYSDSPTKSNATTLFVSGGNYGINTPVPIPSGASYAIFMDGTSTSPYQGSGVIAYAYIAE